ncbi:MAG TPA: glycosyltransferase, partial [Nitrospirota bacterium]
MKVLFTVNGYPPREAAGTELYARDLAAAISGEACLMVFCRTVDRSLPEHSLVRDVVEGSRVVRMVNNVAGALDPERYYSDPKADAIFKGLLDEFRPDIVHIHHLMGLSGGIVAAAKDAGIPVVVTLHDYWFICP